MPEEYALALNYLYPFNPDTEIAFSLPGASKVTLTVYNILGQIVNVLVNYDMQPSHHLVTWNAGDLSSWIYFYRIVAREFITMKRMHLLKRKGSCREERPPGFKIYVSIFIRMSQSIRMHSTFEF